MQGLTNFYEQSRVKTSVSISRNLVVVNFESILQLGQIARILEQLNDPLPRCVDFYCAAVFD